MMNNNYLKKINQAKVYNIEVLNLGNQRMGSLPNELFELKNLKSLDLSKNKLKIIPEQIGDLSNLVELNLSQNLLKDLPRSISKLKNLRQLNIHSNNFTLIPFSIYDLENLEVIRFQDNNIKSIHPKIQKLKKLKILFGGENKIESLPKEIRKLEKLEVLYLASNLLKSIPSEIGELSSLQDLNLYMNKITRLPSDIGYLSQLVNLVLGQNPLENPPEEIIKRGSGAIVNYFRELVSGKQDFLYEAKLLIIGEGGAGKTTMHKKIQNINYNLDTKEKSTEGIEIKPYYFEIDDKKYRVNIWDFGGQEIYHSTHQFFLTKRSLYALVADTRKEDTDFNYWLNVVELLSDNSPIVIVQNEKQDRKKEINIRAIRERFENFKSIVRTNFETNRGLKNLLELIRFEISMLSHIGTALPKTWIEIRKDLEDRKDNYISLQEYLKICSQNGIGDKNKALYLSEYLHDLGIFLHFQDNRVLSKIIILNTEWGTDAVYKLLDDKDIQNNFGRFEFEDLPRIWHENQYDNMYSELLELMIKFELCYPLAESKTFIIPQLLPVNQPIYDWKERGNMIIKYEYDFMPKGIVTRLIVRLHRLIYDHAFVWKEGALIQKDNTYAEVIQVYDSNEIRIRIRGENTKRLSIIITEEVEKIHNLFPRLKVTKFIPCICRTCKSLTTPHFYTYEQLLVRKSRDKETIECEKSYEFVDVDILLNSIQRSELENREEEHSLKEILEEKVKESRLKDVINLLLDYFKNKNDKESLKHLILISSNYKRINDQIKLGVISSNEQSIEMAKLSKSILEIIEIVE